MKIVQFFGAAVPLLFPFMARAEAPSGAVQLWSTFNPDLVDHFYSTNASEVDFLVKFYGFEDEGTSTGYIFTQHHPDTAPLFRLYGIGRTNHLYTTSVEEREHAVKRLGYTSEGVLGFVHTSDGPGRVPLYRLQNKGVHDHYYTTSAPQRDDAARNGWTNEGVAGYIFPFD